MRKLLLLLMCSALAFGQLLAQTRPVTGKVTDENGNPISGASVLIKGTRQGVVTKADGSFLINVTSGTTSLTISNVGYETQTVVASGATLEIKLKISTNPMDEVVVVGFTQTRKKRDEAGAISSIRAASLENLPSLSLDKAMQGKAAGVLVQSNNGIPGGNITVRIRGSASILAGNDPLYVVDGVQMNTRSDANFSQSNPLAFLNPDDIESIDIIKDAATAAIYGSTASNGVVLITTKKGKAGKTKFTVNYYWGQVSPLKYFDVTNAQQYYRLRSEAYGYANLLPYNDLAVQRTVLNELRVVGAATMTLAQADAAAAALPTFDWQRAAYGNGDLQNFELSASGGNDKSTFRISFSATDQKTIVTKADFERVGARIDLTNKATDRLSFTTSLNVSTFNQNVPFAVNGSFLGSSAFSASGIIPTNPIKNADGSYYGTPGNTPANIVGVLNQNIIQVNDFNSGFQRTNQLVGNVKTEYKINNWLTATGFVGMDYRLLQGKRVSDARTADAFVRKGLVQVQSNWNTNLNAFATLNFNHTFGKKNKVDGFIGYEYRKENNASITASGDGFPTYQFTSLQNAANPVAISEFFTGNRRNGVFGTLNYAYNEKYLIGFIFRHDGSSRFGRGFRYGNFPSVKAAWNIDRENFAANSKVVSTLRLRAGYGTVGQDQINDFGGLGLFGGGGIYNGGAGIGYTQLENPGLKWEQTVASNFGIDFGFFKNRITGSFDLYDKRTNDLLFQQPLQATTGFGFVNTNIGKLQNKGVELSLGGDIFKSKRAGGFNWNVLFIYGFNKQQVTELYGGYKILPSDVTIRVGQPVGVLFTQIYAGVNPATGRPMWYDTLGNLTYQVANRDRVVIGPRLLAPTSGGLTNTLRYKGFTVSAFFNYEYGRWATDGQVNFIAENIARLNELTYIYNNRWTTPGQLTSVPRMHVNGTESKGSAAASGNRMFFKADYIRLKNFTLSYDIPLAVATRLHLNSARFYLQGTNLWTYSKWFSYDIEFVGDATGIIPQTRNMTVGIQLGF